MKNLIKLISSFFYLGYSPLMPGTVGSCAALGLYFLFKNNFCLYTVLLIVMSALGFLVCGAAEKIFQQKDSSKIVIDEVAGLLLAFWALPHLNLTLVVIGFFLFRALDALKAYPADKFERIEGAVGIMGDDLVAGAYTNIVLQIAARVFLR